MGKARCGDCGKPLSLPAGPVCIAPGTHMAHAIREFAAYCDGCGVGLPYGPNAAVLHPTGEVYDGKPVVQYLCWPCSGHEPPANDLQRARILQDDSYLQVE